MLLTAAARLIRNRQLRGDQKPAPRGTRAAYWIIVGISLLNLLFVAGVALWGNPPTELGEISLIAQIVLGLGVLAALLTVGALVYMVLAWKNSYWGLAARLYYSLVTVAAVAFVWFLNDWNLLGWRF
jgi:hypothetical protein